MADNSAPCPHCGKAVHPPPKRHRKCPHCGQPIRVRRGHLFTEMGEEEFLERQEKARDQREEHELANRMREFRRIHAQDLRQYKEPPGLFVAIIVHADDASCDYCKSLNGISIPLSECSDICLPPWGQCTHEGGCRCWFEGVYPPEVEEGLPPPNLGAGYKASRERAAQEAATMRETGVAPIHAQPLEVRLQAHKILWGSGTEARRASSLGIGGPASASRPSAPKRRARKSGCLAAFLALLLGTGYVILMLLEHI